MLQKTWKNEVKLSSFEHNHVVSELTNSSEKFWIGIGTQADALEAIMDMRNQSS